MRISKRMNVSKFGPNREENNFEISIDGMPDNKEIQNLMRPIMRGGVTSFSYTPILEIGHCKYKLEFDTIGPLYHDRIFIKRIQKIFGDKLCQD